MQVEINREDIELGIRKDLKRCALARALNRHTEHFQASVSDLNIYGCRQTRENCFEVVDIGLMPSAKEWIKKFDYSLSPITPGRLITYRHPMDNREYGYIVEEK